MKVSVIQTQKRVNVSNKKHTAKGNKKPAPIQLSMDQRLADNFASIVGSWRFIIIQTCFLVAWVALNVYGIWAKWDPYPFILLNLFLSFQAAYTGPVIMMSQNRQSEIDRKTMNKDYELSEEAAESLEAIADVLKASEEDRKRQLFLLKEILEEIEEDEDEDDENGDETNPQEEA